MRYCNLIGAGGSNKTVDRLDSPFRATVEGGGVQLRHAQSSLLIKDCSHTSYSYRAAIRYFVSENQGKVTCKIGLGDNFLLRFDFVFLTTCSLAAYTSSRANRSIQRSYMSNLGPARSV